jgi:rhodanese-related sulfurtransferase
MKAAAPGRIAIPDLEAKLAAKDKPVVVDVRKTTEIAESGAIPGAIHIPVDSVSEQIGELPEDKEIVFYCGGGGRASRAAQAAWDAGYRKVAYCGLRDWKKRGLPTVKAARKPGGSRNH